MPGINNTVNERKIHVVDCLIPVKIKLRVATHIQLIQIQLKPKPENTINDRFDAFEPDELLKCKNER